MKTKQRGRCGADEKNNKNETLIEFDENEDSDDNIRKITALQWL